MKYDLRFLHTLVEAQKLAEASNFKHTARALERILRDEELRTTVTQRGFRRAPCELRSVVRF